MADEGREGERGAVSCLRCLWAEWIDHPWFQVSSASETRHGYISLCVSESSIESRNYRIGSVSELSIDPPLLVPIPMGETWNHSRGSVGESSPAILPAGGLPAVISFALFLRCLALSRLFRSPPLSTHHQPPHPQPSPLMSNRIERTNDKRTVEKHQKILKDLLLRPDNKICADCKKRGNHSSSLVVGGD